MRNTVVLIAVVLFGCACMFGQNTSQVIVSNDDMALQMPAPPPPPPDGAGAPNVIFRAQKSAGTTTISYFAVSDLGKTVTGAPYSATAVTETTQVLADGNRIVNK